MCPQIITETLVVGKMSTPAFPRWIIKGIWYFRAILDLNWLLSKNLWQLAVKSLDNLSRVKKRQMGLSSPLSRWIKPWPTILALQITKLIQKPHKEQRQNLIQSMRKVQGMVSRHSPLNSAEDNLDTVMAIWILSTGFRHTTKYLWDKGKYSLLHLTLKT